VKKLGILITGAMIPAILMAQLTEQWVAAYNGPYGTGWAEFPVAMSVDAAGNTYVTGTGNTTLSPTGKDYVTVKVNSSGALQWAAVYDYHLEDVPTAIATDASGNVYVTGYSCPPGRAGDYVTVKYGANGTQQWICRYDGPAGGWDTPSAIAVDVAGNVYVTGSSMRPGLNRMGKDITTIKYDPNGNEVWVRRYTDSGDRWCEGRDVVVDAAGYVYVAGVLDSDGSNGGLAALKYGASGNLLWVSRHDGPGLHEAGHKIALDVDGNVIVTGKSTYVGPSTLYLTVKYNSSGAEQWWKTYDDLTGNDDAACAVVTDASGSIYVTGHSKNSTTGYDYATIKYSPLGEELWVRRYDVYSGNLEDRATGLALDASGSIVVTGYSARAVSGMDYATVKYSPDGTELWVSRYDGPVSGNDEARAIGVDPQGNVYVTGNSVGDGSSHDFLTVKYSSDGAQQWVSRYGRGYSADAGQRVAMDALGNVYVTGYSVGTSQKNDYVTIKYDPDGETLWTRRYNGPLDHEDCPTAIAVDGDGNVYVTGYSIGLAGWYDCATIKYASDGTMLWVDRYERTDGRNDCGYALAVDGSGFVYVTGYTGAWADVLTIKYAPSGSREWVAVYNNPSGGHDVGWAVTADASGNVYVAGHSRLDYLLIKYSSTGVEQWSRRADYGGDDQAKDVAVDASGNAYITGTGNKDYVTAKYNSAGTREWFQRHDGLAYTVDAGWALELDGTGVYVTGQSSRPESGLDFYTVKYDLAGTRLWDRWYTSAEDRADAAQDIALDGAGNVYVTGYCTRAYSGEDYATLMYDAATGVQLAFADYTGLPHKSDRSLSVATGPAGTVCITGYALRDPALATDMVTIKYQSLQPPEAPVLVSPKNGATGVPIEGDLTWEASERATSYEVTLDGNTYTVTGNSYHYSGLSYLTEYEWDVVAVNDAGSTPSSNGPFTFATIIEKPGPFDLISPADDATGVPIEGNLTWEASERATSYEVTLGGNTYTVTENSYHYSGLDYLTKYKWNVVAVNDGGSTSSGTGPYSFTTIIEKPGPFDLISPADGATGVPVEGDLTWEASERATSYEVTLNGNTYTVTDNSYRYSGLSYLTEYTWNVTAKNAGGERVSANGPFTFTTIIEKPGPFDLSTPPDHATGVSIQGDLTWQGSERATSYEVTLGGNTYTVTENSYHYSGLDYLAKYEWNVVALNDGGSTPSSNGPFTFTTIIEKPARFDLIAPANEAVDQELAGVLEWNASNRAEHYDVYLGTDPKNLPRVSENQTGLSWDYSGLSCGTVYYWKVVAKNAGGETGSEVWSFTTGTLDAGMTEIIEPSGLIDTTSKVPQATVHNFGTLDRDLTTWFEIRYGAADGPVQYLQSVTVYGLGDEDQTATFPTWDVPNDQEGAYYAKSWTELEGDIDATNDTARSQFVVASSDPDPWSGSTLTQGYWKTHPYYDPQHPDDPYIEKYLPVTIAGVRVSTVPEALAIFNPPKPMTAWKMFLIQFLAAKLNAGWQTDPSLLDAWYNYPGGDYPFDSQQVSAIFQVADGYRSTTDKDTLDEMKTVLCNINEYTDTGNRCLWDAPFPAGSGVQGVEVAALAAKLYLSVAPSLVKSGVAHIAYGLPQAAPAQLTVLDVTGRTVVTRGLPAEVGDHVILLDTRSWSAGAYFVRITGADLTATRKLVVQR